MSFLRTGPWCLVLLLGLVPAPASAADKQAVLEFAMAVDAQGHPTDVRAPEGLSPSIGESVQAWARDLRFVPATVDGVAQPSTTTLYLTFSVGDDGTSQIVNASTGPGLVLGRTGEPPVHDGAGYVRIEYDGTGKVTDAHFEHQAAHNVDRSFWRWAESFAKNTTIVPETVGGAPVAGTARIPLLYCRQRCPPLPPLPTDSGTTLGDRLVAESLLRPATGTGTP